MWDVWLVYAPARGAREDIALRRDTVFDLHRIAEAKLGDVRRTREVAEEAFAQVSGCRGRLRKRLVEARRTRRVAEQALAQAEAAVRLAERNLAVVTTIEGRMVEFLALTREQLAAARENLRVDRETSRAVKEINDKTVDPPVEPGRAP